MCGILVVMQKDGVIDAAACRRGLATMHWRGPDFRFSKILDNRLFLGQTLLSITGTPMPNGAHQTSMTGRHIVLYNGEIYNFRELADRHLAGRRYDTDTEMLVNLHDRFTPEDVPALLDGMFAYVVFDSEARKLHITRDVQGEKSLYVYEDRHRIVIASEIEAIRTLLPWIPVDPQALRDYFRTRHLMLFDRTVYHGIKQVLPGQFLTVDLDSCKLSVHKTRQLRDWIDPVRLEENRSRSTDSLADELDALLTQCVKEMIPQRRYAAVVSGGVDSSLIAHYLVRHGNPDALVALDHIGKDLISCDLSGFCGALNRDIEIWEVYCDKYAASIAVCQKTCGAPLHSHSFVGQALLSRVVRESDIPVLFGGEGADEYFGGYDAYLRIAADTLPQPYSPSPYTAHSEPLVKFSEDDPDRLQEQLCDAWGSSLDAYRGIEGRAQLAAMYCDAAYQLPEVGLRGADLMSMCCSVETRSVYARRPIVQFALNLPAIAKVDTAQPPLMRTKVLLKNLFVRYFGQDLLKEKQGFSGFPNESAITLAEPHDFVALDVLKVRRDSLKVALQDRATSWKLINVEHFLRNCGGATVAQLAEHQKPQLHVA